MPNRIIKETICTSEEIDGLSDAQEVLFYRLMVNCDDFGLFDGRPKIIASKCYPLKSIDINDIQAMLGALQSVGLVSVYEVEGRPYIAITNWAKHQQIRAKRAKYPMPECGHEITCNQLIANVHVNQSNPIQSESNPIQSLSSPNGLLVIGDAELPVDKPAKNGKHYPICPHQKIIEVYQSRLPTCPSVVVWNETRKRTLQSLWREKASALKWKTEEDGIEWFDRFFSFVSESDFLTGKASSNNGRKPFVANLEWLIKPANFAKIVEGNYHA